MKKMKVVAQILTYNEKENVGPMMDAWLKIAKGNPKYDFEILVIDDESPDGTGEIVKKYAKKNNNIFLLSHSREGYGKAMIRGYKYSMEELKADIIIPIDVDFQWDPYLAPKLLEKIDEGYDVVVASRGIPGASDDFTPFRKLTHWVSDTLFAYYLAGIKEVKDHAGSFKAIRVKGHMDKVDLDKINVRGFVVQMKTLYELSKTNAKFFEVAAHYGERKAGTPTTVGLKSLQWFVKYIIEYMKVALEVRFERTPALLKFIKFGIVGGFGFVINFVGLMVFNRLLKIFPWPIGVINFIANALASEISIISNFTWNNIWTFSKEKIISPGQLVKKFTAFNFSSIIGGILVPSFVIGAGTQMFGDQYRSILLVVAVFGFTVPYNWFIYNKFIWKKKK